MTNRLLTRAALLAACFLGLAHAEEPRAPSHAEEKAGEAPVPAKDAAGWERYQVVVQRNIFAKDRARGRGDHRPAEQAVEEMGPPAPKTETDSVLIGLLEKDGQLVAFLENTRTGAVQTLRTGDALGSGKVGTLTLNSMEFVSGETSLTVSVGQKLDGSAAGTLSEPVKSSAGSGSPEANAILERLRKKRQEEMSK